jgi:hypothetical protein
MSLVDPGGIADLAPCRRLVRRSRLPRQPGPERMEVRRKCCSLSSTELQSSRSLVARSDEVEPTDDRAA